MFLYDLEFTRNYYCYNIGISDGNSDIRIFEIRDFIILEILKQIPAYQNIKKNLLKSLL